MKIGPLENKPVAPVAPVERKAAPAQGKDEPSAQVALSPAASLLANVPSEPAFDAEKVQRIAQAIREGRFVINAEVIADKLILNAQELLGRNQG
jgi:negative regulator of flagellin synthesis FlgM